MCIWWTVRKRGGKDAQNLVLNNPRHRFNSVPFTANVHKHSIPLILGYLKDSNAATFSVDTGIR